MKAVNRVIVLLVMSAVVLSCRDRAAEKRIAELESRIAQMENKAVTPTPANAVTPTPAAPEEKPEGPLPISEYETVDHDFGTVSEGQKVMYDYKFKNNGQAPLIIQNAAPSCGCTVPTWSKEPIPVGGTGFIRAEFDTNGKSGIQNKTITVTANTWPKVTTLRFKAMVTPKPTGANGPVK